ncbi:hypothetical protein LRS74_15095 [Streptomyces sp. LX-29]|uniref:hypothetical protein n=1 Tax=Streptomyces sp. LX-29 TaxID=2900152 RepID=UPI00240E12C0|nr:hypothetical protein [Streptomyces sp. LX-29]WFB08232.1 hypothetical protein LRS74_15095 [Streptomyces sp. LX-29]
MKTTFEDRLLAELTSEMRLDSAIRTEPVARRRLVTVRRAALGLAACGAAAAGAVALPGPATTSAYAVEKHSDGTVTVSVEDASFSPEQQRGLARELRKAGVKAVIDNPPAGMGCAPTRGRQEGRIGFTDGAPTDEDPTEAAGKTPAPEPTAGDAAPNEGWDLGHELKPGDTLTIENRRLTWSAGDDDRRSVVLGVYRGEVGPCVPERLGDELSD